MANLPCPLHGITRFASGTLTPELLRADSWGTHQMCCPLVSAQTTGKLFPVLGIKLLNFGTPSGSVNMK